VGESTGSGDDSGRRALDKIEAVEALSRFFAVLQRYHCEGIGFEDFDEVIDDGMAYLSPNFLDETPKPRGEFLEWFQSFQSVHAREGRGSLYLLVAPVVTLDGDTARVEGSTLTCHWLSSESDQSTWYYGPVEATVNRRKDGWRIARVSTKAYRAEGHLPGINYKTPDLVAG
jgi:hypothetical protein